MNSTVGLYLLLCLLVQAKVRYTYEHSIISKKYVPSSLIDTSEPEGYCEQHSRSLFIIMSIGASKGALHVGTFDKFSEICRNIPIGIRRIFRQDGFLSLFVLFSSPFLYSFYFFSFPFSSLYPLFSSFFLDNFS